MKQIENPKNGAAIKEYVVNKIKYDLLVGETKPFADPVADALLNAYHFLREIKLEGKFVCKFGDYAHDTRIAVISHERGHKEDPPVEQGKEFITPFEQADIDRRERFEDRQRAEDDSAGLEGPGLEEDNEFATGRASRF